MVVNQITDESRFTGICLSTVVKPVLYDVTLEPNFKQFTFLGKVSIKVEIENAGEPISEIVLHANELDFSDAFFEADAGGQPQKNPVQDVILGPKTEKAILVFEEPIKAQSGSLNISFTGTLNDKMCGFYRSKYTSPNGEESFAAVTRFDDNNARRAFPCWDDERKARFLFNIVVDNDEIALSIMNIQNESTRPNGKKILTFLATPKIQPRYNIILVGKPEFIENKFGGRPLRLQINFEPEDEGRSAQLDCLLQISDLQENVSEIFDSRVKIFCGMRMKKLVQRSKSTDKDPEQLANEVASILSVYMREKLAKSMQDFVNSGEVQSKIDSIWEYNRGHCVYDILPLINETSEKFISDLKCKLDILKSMDEYTPSIECQSYRNKYVTMRTELDSTIDQIENVCSKVASRAFVDLTRRA